MKIQNFRFYTICNITQDPQELRRYNCISEFFSKSDEIKYHQLLSKVKCIYGKLRFAFYQLVGYRASCFICTDCTKQLYIQKCEIWIFCRNTIGVIFSN